jgi:hypothetical protein
LTYAYDDTANSSSRMADLATQPAGADASNGGPAARLTGDFSRSGTGFVAAEDGTAAIRWAGRDPNYRANLTKVLGKPPAGEYDAHHVLPVEFGQDFARVGIDANAPQYGTWVPRAEHQGFSSEYAKDWGAFLRGSPNQTQVLDFARMMAGKYGFDVHF